MVPRRMKFDGVASPAIPIEGVQDRRIPVRLHTPLDDLGAAKSLAECPKVILGPGRPFARHRLAEHPIALVQVVVDEGRRLIEYLVRHHLTKWSRDPRRTIPRWSRRD